MSARAGKGPVKADHTIYKPSSGADTLSTSGALAGKATNEWHRRTPSPTKDRLRKSPSPTSVPALRTHTPSPTSFNERLRKTPSPRGSGHKPLVSTITRSASTTPRKTPSPSDLRRSPEASPGGSAAANKRKHGLVRSQSGGLVTIKRSMSAISLPRAKGEPNLARSQPPSRSGGGSRATPPTPVADAEFSELRRFLPGQDEQMIDALASRLKELRRLGGRTLDAGTQTVCDAGTQTFLRGADSGGDDLDDGDDGEVAQIALAGTERSGGLHGARAGGTPTFLRRSRSSSAGSDRERDEEVDRGAHGGGAPFGGCGGGGGGQHAWPSAPVEMMANLALSSPSACGAWAEKPRHPTAIHLSKHASSPIHAAAADAPGAGPGPQPHTRSARSTPERRERERLGTADASLAAPARAWQKAPEAAEQMQPTRRMRPTSGAALHALARERAHPSGPYGSDGPDGPIEPEPPGLLERTEIAWCPQPEQQAQPAALHQKHAQQDKQPQQFEPTCLDGRYENRYGPAAGGGGSHVPNHGGSRRQDDGSDDDVDQDDDDMREIETFRRNQLRQLSAHGAGWLASHAHAPGPDPIKMLSDGRHNAASLFSAVPHAPPQPATSSHARRPGSRGPLADAGTADGGGGGGHGAQAAHTQGAGGEPHALRDAWAEQAHHQPALRSAERERENRDSERSEDSCSAELRASRSGLSAHRRTGSWGQDSEGCGSTQHAGGGSAAHAYSSAAKSPKQNGTSLFGSDLAAAAAGKLSLPVPARPARTATIPRLDLREMERPHSAPGEGLAAAAARGVCGRPSALGSAAAAGDAGNGESDATGKGPTRASPRGLVTSRSDVSIGSPRSAFTSVSSPRSLVGSTNSTPRNPLPPIAGQVQTS